MKNIYLDCETENLDPTSTLHCVVVVDLETGMEHAYTWYGRFGCSHMSDLYDVLDEAEYIVGHNVLNFDFHVLKHHLYSKLNPYKFVDTLILAQLYDPRLDNSLDALGKRLCNEAKTEFNDFEKLTPEMIEYCKDDCRLGIKVYKKLINLLEREGSGEESMELEHNLQCILEQQRINGLPVDPVKLNDLDLNIRLRQAQLDDEIKIAFPPTVKQEVFVPKRDNKTKGYVKGVPFIKETLVPFNMNSNQQVIDKLDEYGWKPFVKTKGHLDILKLKRKRPLTPEEEIKLRKFEVYGWKLDEDNLNTIPSTAPKEIKYIPEYKMLTSRLGLVNNYKQNLGKDNRIHGVVRGLGATTHRSSHKDPNLANVPGKASSPYAKQLRELVVAPEGSVFVGTDADAIQLRILAHLMDDPDYINAVVTGKEEDGTDVHSINARSLGGVSRDTAKTFIYAFVLNAGIAKLAQILGCSVGEAKQRYDMFLKSTPALAELKGTWVPRMATQGYVLGPDGRKMKVSNEHFVLATALQGYEKIIMAKANIIWDKELKDIDIPFKQVAFVHDEWLVEVPNVHQYPQRTGSHQAAALTQAGLELGIKARITGKPKIGRTWYDVH